MQHETQNISNAGTLSGLMQKAPSVSKLPEQLSRLMMGDVSSAPWEALCRSEQTSDEQHWLRNTPSDTLSIHTDEQGLTQ